MGGLVVMLFEFSDHFGTGNKQGVANVVNGNGGVDGLIQFRQDLLGNGRALGVGLGLFCQLHKDLKQIFAGGLVDLVVINGDLFQLDDSAHFRQNIRILEHIGLLQTVLIENIKEHIAFEIDPDLLEGVVFVCGVLVGRTGFQQKHIGGR